MDPNIEQQLYEEFFSATDRLLNEAKSIIDNRPSEADEDRILALMDAGFSNFKEAIAYKESLQKRIFIAFAEYYAIAYPFNRFVTEEEVQRICTKYALYLTGTDDYIDDIPRKNQDEILKFKVRECDIRHYEDNFKWAPKDSELLKQLRQNMATYEAGERPISRGTNLRIAAPEHKLDMTNKIKHGHILIKDDPIVLQPVLKGFLIITSWGLEAGDALAVNAINN
jgi:hypothetical protein